MAGERYVDVIYGHEESVRSLAYSPNGKIIVSGGGDGKVRFWHLGKRRCIEEVGGFKSTVLCVSYSPDGKMWAAMDREGTITIFCSDGTKITNKAAACSGFCWTPDSRNLVCTNGTGRVCLYNLQSRQPLYAQKHADQEVYALAVSPDGRYIASGGSDFVIKLWDMSEGHELPPLEQHKNNVMALAFSPDSKLLGSGDKGSMLCYWALCPGEKKTLLKNYFQWSGHEITDIAFCPCYSIFASTGTDNRVRLFDVDNGNRRLEELSGHGRVVYSIAFSPCGQFLASGGGDHKIIVWNIKKPQHVS